MHGKGNPMETLLYSEAPIRPASQHPIQALKELIEKERLKCDYVICPGDISNKMCKQGIISGFNYIEEIKAKLGASMSFFTPGNHDRDSRNKFNSCYSAEPLRTLVDNYPFNGDEGLINNFWANGFCIYKNNSNGIEFLLIDSTFTHHTSTKAEQSIIPQHIIEIIEKSIKSDSTESSIRIAICHHNPIKISNSDCTQFQDTDVIENGDKLIQILAENKYDLLIHGHKHVPYLQIYNTLPILSAGSFSAVENILESGSYNTFHIIELFKDGTTCNGIVSTWVFKRGFGWQRNTDPYSTLPGMTGFGATEIYAREINQWIEDQKKDRIKFSDLKRAFPKIVFLTPLQQHNLINELKTKFNLEFHPELTIGPSEIAKQMI